MDKGASYPPFVWDSLSLNGLLLQCVPPLVIYPCPGDDGAVRAVCMALGLGAEEATLTALETRLLRQLELLWRRYSTMPEEEMTEEQLWLWDNMCRRLRARNS